MFRRFFNRKDDRVRELTLSTLESGCMVDFDLETYEVTAVHRYRYEGDFQVKEFELRSASRTLYLEREEDDDVLWGLSEKIPHGRLTFGGRPASEYVVGNDRAPAKVEFDGEDYFLEDDSAAHFFRQGSLEPTPVVVYDFVHADGRRFVTLERWGEEEFEAAAGRHVREYEFTNLLPAPDNR